VTRRKRSVTGRKRSVTGEIGDLSDLPFLDDAERAESAWLLARDHDPHAPAPSPEIAADYAKLEHLLASTPTGTIDERWHDDVVRAAAARASRPWWRTPASRWVIGGVLATAAAVVVWIRLPREPKRSTPAAPDLEVAVLHTGVTRGGSGEAAIGDHLVVTARPREAGDLRVYRSDGTLLARCPRGPGCKQDSHGVQTIELTLDAPDQYQVILVDGVSDAPPDGAIDAYLDAARAAHARITAPTPIDVR
jgi:hypothetical protein